MYGNIHYFEFYSQNKKLNISFNNHFGDISNKINSTIKKNISIRYLNHNDIISVKRLHGMKVGLNVKDQSSLDFLDWCKFKDYTYCILQVSNKICFVGINNINNIDIHRSKVVCTKGNISLYELCVNLNILYIKPTPYEICLAESNQLFKDVQVTLLDNILYFIKWDNNEDILRCLTYFRILKLLKGGYNYE